eukprot:GEMP01034673.1.p1 GENE.GEMP01034673.1~~GEMP01034673.1.p1  ORF type:complete len:380 (+),score=65.08 GEMP01034673.1:31-1140(+)
MKCFNRCRETFNRWLHWASVEKKYVPTPITGPVLFCLSHRLAAFLLVIFIGIFATIGFCFNAVAPTTSAFHAPSMHGSFETKVMHIIVDAMAFYFVPRGYVAVMNYDLKGCVLFFYYALFRFCIFVPIFGVQLILGDLCSAQKHGYTWVSKSRPHPMRCSKGEIAEVVFVCLSFLVNSVLLKAFYDYWGRVEMATDRSGVSEKTGLTARPPSVDNEAHSPYVDDEAHPPHVDDEAPESPKTPDNHLPLDPSHWPGLPSPQHKCDDDTRAATTPDHAKKTQGFFSFTDSDEFPRSTISAHAKRLSLPVSSTGTAVSPRSKYVIFPRRGATLGSPKARYAQEKAPETGEGVRGMGSSESQTSSSTNVQPGK